MNKERRNKIDNVINNLENIISDLTNILSAEEITFESMPENLQYSERWEISSETIEKISDSIDILQEVCEKISKFKL